MNTALWGPAAWKVLHTLPWLYAEPELTPEQREEVVGFYYALANVLPCIHCRTSVRALLKAYPPRDYAAQRVQLAQYASMLHNLVNLKLGKPLQKNLGTALSAAASSSRELHAALLDFLWFLARNYTAGDDQPPTTQRRRQYRRFFARLRQVMSSDAQLAAALDTMPEDALHNRRKLKAWLQRVRAQLLD